MANIKSSKKRAELAAERNEINSQMRSRMRNQIKNCDEAIESNHEQKEVLLKETISTIDKMARKGLLHKKKASRKISQLQKKYNKSMA